MLRLAHSGSFPDPQKLIIQEFTNLMQKDGRRSLSQNFYIPQEVVETKIHTTFERESLRSDGENPVFKLLE